MSSNYFNVPARHYLRENIAAEAILRHYSQVLQSPQQQMAYLQLEAIRRANPSHQWNYNNTPFPSQPTGLAIQPLLNSSFRQLHQSEAPFARTHNTGSMGIGNGIDSPFATSAQRQLDYIRSTIITNQGSDFHSIGADQSTTNTLLPENGSTNDCHSSTVMTELQSPAHDLFPFSLAHADDQYNLSSHQQYLRLHIQAFQASAEDVHTYVRGRNRPILIGQIGIRCRHCAHIKLSLREKGSTYYPAKIVGIYQAAQNMSTTHIQCGRCPHMPNAIKEHFKSLIATKASSNGAGRTYWAEKGRAIGLIDTERGIFYYAV